MSQHFPLPLSAQAVIDLSDAAARLSSARWSEAFIRTGFPSLLDADLAGLPLGSRDALVVGLRKVLRGSVFECEPECSACTAKFSLNFAVTDVGFGTLAEADPAFQETEIDGEMMRLRPVTLGDVIEIEALADAGLARAHLLARVTEGHRDGAAPDDQAINAALEMRDPLADIWLDCACPDCGTDQLVAFDPVSFVAQELRQMAQGILRDVVDIARVFHWSEADILALPDARRAYYVNEALA